MTIMVYFYKGQYDNAHNQKEKPQGLRTLGLFITQPKPFATISAFSSKQTAS